jgi:hypothetical protein
MDVYVSKNPVCLLMEPDKVEHKIERSKVKDLM